MTYFVLLVCSSWRTLQGRPLRRRWLLVVARGYGFLLMTAVGLDVVSGIIDASTLGLRWDRVGTLVILGVAVYGVVTVQVNWWKIRACEAYCEHKKG